MAAVGSRNGDAKEEPTAERVRSRRGEMMERRPEVMEQTQMRVPWKERISLRERREPA